jgi:hypothetical protein
LIPISEEKLSYFQLFAGKLIKVKVIMLNKIRQSHKARISYVEFGRVGVGSYESERGLLGMWSWKMGIGLEK